MRNEDNSLTDLGNLNLITDELTVTDLQDTDMSESSGANLSVSVSSGKDEKGEHQLSSDSTTVGLTNQGHRKEQTTAGTLGGGTITRRDGSEHELGDTNRDLDQRQVVTLDQQTGGLNATVTVDHRLLSEEGREDIVESFKLAGQAAGQVADATIDGVDYVADEIAVLGDDLPEELRAQLGETGELFVDDMIRKDATDEQIAEVLQREKVSSGLGGIEEYRREKEENPDQSLIVQSPSDDTAGDSGLAEIPETGEMGVIVVQADPNNIDVSTAEKATAGMGVVSQDIKEISEENPELAMVVQGALVAATGAGGAVKALASELANRTLEAVAGDEMNDLATTHVNHGGGFVTGGTAEEFASGVEQEEQDPGSRSSELGKSDVDIRDGLVFAGSVLLGIDGVRGGGKGPNQSNVDGGNPGSGSNTTSASDRQTEINRTTEEFGSGPDTPSNPNTPHSDNNIGQNNPAYNADGQQKISNNDGASDNRPLNNDDLLWTSWKHYQKVTIGDKSYAVIGNRNYSHHAVDRMQPSGLGAPAGTLGAGRNVTPNMVEHVIRNGTSTTSMVNGAPRTVYKSGNVSVVTENGGKTVVTILRKGD
ncbi:hypothetical protein [Bacterioplanes sanyensis]|uniref:hypothetical protein n=1 Tax=Bacterioplanes sanyensis TaxID=1249553 RepID=UPI0012FE5AE1|nr:hypothetical protein [Bacterioplanes sanyensis]